MHKHTYANTQTHTRSNNKLNNITLIKIIFHMCYIHAQTYICKHANTHIRSNNKLNNITFIKIIFHVLYTCTNIHMQTRKHTHVPITNLIILH